MQSSSEPRAAADTAAAPSRNGFRARLLRGYYSAKYRLFRGERRPLDGRRGLVALQIDALGYATLRHAIELGYCPTLAEMLREDYALRRWFCGLPSATPYCQAGIFHGENDDIPAFRFYDRRLHRIIACNTPSGVQYIRDRLRSTGALAGGSSYVNLLDGDAQTVAFTVVTRERTSVWERLGGTRMVLLVLLHPIRLLRMIFQAVAEWLREEWERTVGELRRRHTHSEGFFPFLRVFTNVVVRELQTMAVMLDIHLGVPVIYSTFMQYDELGHHFGPLSWQALRDLKRTDARVAEIRRMIETAGGRPYDLVILSDHGMTPARSYRMQFGETLGRTVERALEEAAGLRGQRPLRTHASFGADSEYADAGERVLETVAHMTPAAPRVSRLLRRARDWLRRSYGLRELLIAEKYYVADTHAVVVTYSSCLALLYFAEREDRPDLRWMLDDAQRASLYHMLLAHPGIGLLATLMDGKVHLEHRNGRAVLTDATLEVLGGESPLHFYGSEAPLLRALEHLVRQPNAGDIVILGEYDGYEIVSFDDQVGAHGGAGGDQLYPFLVSPHALALESERIEDARDVHRVLMSRYAAV